MVNAGTTIPAGHYILRRTILVTNNVLGVGLNTHFTFQPTAPFLECQNDRAFTTPCDSVYDRTAQAFRQRRRIPTAIAAGDTSFQSADDVSDLVPGDWLIITDKDNRLNDVVTIDWVQVAFVSGQRVFVTIPFRTSFSNKRAWDPIYGGLGFLKSINSARNVMLRNFSLDVVNPDPLNGTAAISIFAAQRVSVDTVQVTNPTGQALYSYLSQHVSFSNCKGFSGTVLSEFAATTDLQISSCEFSSNGDAALGLDLGTAHFSVEDSTTDSFGTGFYLLYGVHDGTVRGMHIPFVNASGDAIGILARGTQNVEITGNQLDGGLGASSMGLSIGPAWNLEIPIGSSGNSVAPNSFGSQWALDYDPSNQP